MESMENRTAISNEEIIAALISCGSIAQAAEQLNMSQERSMTAWDIGTSRRHTAQPKPTLCAKLS